MVIGLDHLATLVGKGCHLTDGNSNVLVDRFGTLSVARNQASNVRLFMFIIASISVYKTSQSTPLGLKTYITKPLLRPQSNEQP